LLPDFGTGSPKSGSKKIKEPEQDRQNLGASKRKNINRIDKIWEEENQRV
jgi:hypothetical protein